MSGTRTVKLWSSELEEEIEVSLSPKFWKWYDGKRRRYLTKYPNCTDDQRIKLAYDDFMS